MAANKAVGNEALKPVGDLCAELADRLRAGDHCCAEDFFPALPGMDTADAALELVYTEFVVRKGLGQRPSSAVWLARFPQWRDRLERMLQIGDLFDEVDDLLADDSIPKQTTRPEPAADASEELAATRDPGPPAKGRTSLPDPDPWVDEYELLECIGRGGMGVVHKARQLALNRIVALKAIIAGQYAEPDQRARFRREAESMARLRHPNIVPVYSVGERDGCPYFSMEFVEGHNLAQRIAGKPQPERQAARWVEVLARAVSYAHQQGLVHRDLKPSNVVLTTDGVPKITDFGLAKFLGAEPGEMVAYVGTGAAPNGEPAGPTVDGVRTASTPNENSLVAGARPGAVGPESVTVTGMTLGTPAYMAPEQAAGHTSEVGPLTDVYALGAILYELLTGQAPFSSKACWHTLQDVQEREPPRPRALNPRVDPDLEAVCLKCLKKKPCARYPSAEALADDLARWLRGKRTRVRPLLPWTARIRCSLRRHPVVCAITILAAIGAVAAPTVAYLRDPARRLACIEATLAQGNPVTLVGETGMPEWFRWRTTKGPPTVAHGPDGVFTVQSPRACALLELLPDPQHEHYRFSAEVRQESGLTHHGKIGIYFAHSSQATANGPAQFFASLSFNDNARGSPTGAENSVQSEFFFLNEQTLANVGRCASWPFAIFPAVSDLGQGPWHRLVVEVTAERFEYFWDDQLVHSLSRAEWLQEIKAWIEKYSVPGERIPQFAPRDSLGLYVWYCEASFRRVIVEPLGDSN
jgi:serine/threonine-protein kinase